MKLSTKVDITPPRFLAILLIFGGFAGNIFLIRAIIEIYVEYGGLVDFISAVILLTLFVAFIWSMVKGFDLWRGKSSGYKWAKILFAAQILSFNTPLLNYSFWLGLHIGFEFYPSQLHFSWFAGTGASGVIYLFPESINTVLQFNLVAIAALAYLLVAKPNLKKKNTG